MDFANTPTLIAGRSTFAQETAMQEQQVEQDPVLEGTGQPGELYGAPEKPSLGYVEQSKKALKLYLKNLMGRTL